MDIPDTQQQRRPPTVSAHAVAHAHALAPANVPVVGYVHPTSGYSAEEYAEANYFHTQNGGHPADTDGVFGPVDFDSVFGM